MSTFDNVLIIDDALGSGATSPDCLNQIFRLLSKSSNKRFALGEAVPTHSLLFPYLDRLKSDRVTVRCTDTLSAPTEMNQAILEVVTRLISSPVAPPNSQIVVTVPKHEALNVTVDIKTTRRPGAANIEKELAVIDRILDPFEMMVFKGVTREGYRYMIRNKT